MSYQAFYKEVLDWFEEVGIPERCDMAELRDILHKYKPEPYEPIKLVYPKGCGILGEDLDD